MTAKGRFMLMSSSTGSPLRGLRNGSGVGLGVGSGVPVGSGTSSASGVGRADCPPPQAARESSMAAQSTAAKNFFIVHLTGGRINTYLIILRRGALVKRCGE